MESRMELDGVMAFLLLWENAVNIPSPQVPEMSKNKERKMTLMVNVDTWTDFPESQTGPLVNNLTFAFLGNSYECNLYK